MTLTVRRFAPEDADAWDDFCGGCLQTTFLHTRRFLSYHGNRFEDASLIIERDGACVGLFAAAVAPGLKSLVVSHPGLTYGGVVHRGALRGESMVQALQAIRDHYAEAGFERLLYKAVPSIYHRAPAQDDLYALFRLRFSRTRCDLSSAIDLSHRLHVSDRRLRGAKKALKNGVQVACGRTYAAPIWDVLQANLKNRFDAKPVHTLAEIALLADRFPENIRFVCATVESDVVAGVVLFETSHVTHAQYIASSDEGYRICALDLIFDWCIDAASKAGKRWFDFGISNENAGQFLNEGLYEFKSNFGGGGIVHEFYELDLTLKDAS